MLYYSILLLIYFLLSIGEMGKVWGESKRNAYCFLLMLPMWALVAFRGENIGCDTPHYIFAWNYAQFYDSFMDQWTRTNMEVGYVWVRWLFIHYDQSFFIFQIVVSSFIYFSLFKYFIRYSPNIAMSCLLFLVTMRMFSTMNQTRMWIALAILLFSIRHLLNQKWWPFLIIVFIASLFHKSSILFLIMYPLCVLKYNRINAFLIIAGSIFITFLGASFFGWFTDMTGMYEGYMDNVQFSEDRSKLAVTLILLETIVFFFFFKNVGMFKCEQYQTAKQDGLNCIQFGFFSKMSFFIVLGLSIIGLSNNIMGRVSAYFSIIMTIMIPIAVNKVSSNNRLIAFFIITTALFIEFGVRLYFRPYWYDVTPYQWGFIF